jgi:hypothetical protein
MRLLNKMAPTREYALRFTKAGISPKDYLFGVVIPGEVNILTARTPRQLGEDYVNHRDRLYGPNYCNLGGLSLKPDFELLLLGRQLFEVQRMNWRQRRKFKTAIIVATSLVDRASKTICQPFPVKPTNIPVKGDHHDLTRGLLD